MTKHITVTVLDGIELHLSTVPGVWDNSDYPYPNIRFDMLDSNTGGVAEFIGFIAITDEYTNTWAVDWEFVFDQAHQVAALELTVNDEVGRHLIPRKTNRWIKEDPHSDVYKSLKSYSVTYIYSVTREVPELFAPRWVGGDGGSQMTVKDNGLLLDYRDGEMDTEGAEGTIVVTVKQTRGEHELRFTKLARPIWMVCRDVPYFSQHDYKEEGPYSPDALIDAILEDMSDWMNNNAKTGITTEVEFYLGGRRSVERYPHRTVTIEKE